MRGPDVERESPKAFANHRAKCELVAFFAAVFVVTWELGALIIFARPQLESLIGPIGIVNQHWLYYIAVSAPTLCAAVIAAVSGRMAGLLELLMSLLRNFDPSLKGWRFSVPNPRRDSPKPGPSPYDSDCPHSLYIERMFFSSLPKKRAWWNRGLIAASWWHRSMNN
jgi:hypothetical protein